MKFYRYLTLPLVPVYYVVTTLRNMLYETGIKRSKSYDFPIICVGNLSTGGTGKTPMVEYLLRLLKSDYRLATLSRGYGRQTKGFLLGSEIATADTLGDEPFQFYTKFKSEVQIAVSENRQHGIALLRNLEPQPEVIVLDDAFQHRKVKAGLNILLSTYAQRYTEDWLLPAGNLRESKRGANRAQIIVITKCPSDIGLPEKDEIIKSINPKPGQQVFFSSISYADRLSSKNESLALNDVPSCTLVTGIANARPLLAYLKEKKLQFEHLEYKDHYHFTAADVKQLMQKSLIICTEKDYMRLKAFPELADKLYYLPIEVKLDRSEEFNSLIAQFARH